jgi:hypothetical protein
MAQSPKRPRDPNQLAKFIVDTVTAEDVREKVFPLKPKAASGGLKGGPARAAKLTPERRSQIAAKAAQARWNKKPKA